MLINGCASKLPDPITINAVPLERPVLTLPSSDVLKLKEVKWVIVTPENAESVFAEIGENGNAVLFALTDQGYTNISLNLSDIMRLIEQKNAIIAAYRGYYESYNTAADENALQAAKDKAAVDQYNQELSLQDNDNSPWWKFGR